MARPHDLQCIALLFFLTGCASTVVPIASDIGPDAARDGVTASCPARMILIPAAMFEIGDPMADDPGAQPVHGRQRQRPAGAVVRNPS